MEKEGKIFFMDKTMEVNVFGFVVLILQTVVYAGLFVWVAHLHGVKVEEQRNTYATTGIVTNVDLRNDIVTVEDYNGFIRQFAGCEDWYVNDIITMTMDSKGTDEILDDEIVSCRYSGYIEGGWQR